MNNALSSVSLSTPLSPSSPPERRLSTASRLASASLQTSSANAFGGDDRDGKPHSVLEFSSESPMRSPRHTESRLSTSPVGFSTPTKSLALSSHASDFLTAMGRSDLIVFTQTMNELFGQGEWAFTGSVALTLHMERMGAKSLSTARVPNDVDILVSPRRAFLVGLAAERFKEHIKDVVCANPWRNYSTLTFSAHKGHAFSVDLLSERCFGSLAEDMVTLSDISVVTLESLADRKRSILREMRSERVDCKGIGGRPTSEEREERKEGGERKEGLESSQNWDSGDSGDSSKRGEIDIQLSKVESDLKWISQIESYALSQKGKGESGGGVGDSLDPEKRESLADIEESQVSKRYKAMLLAVPPFSLDEATG